LSLNELDEEFEETNMKIIEFEEFKVVNQHVQKTNIVVDKIKRIGDYGSSLFLNTSACVDPSIIQNQFSYNASKNYPAKTSCMQVND
jgi:hypothetical protein